MRISEPRAARIVCAVANPDGTSWAAASFIFDTFASETPLTSASSRLLAYATDSTE